MNRVLAGIYEPRSSRDWVRTRAALEDAIEGEAVSVAQEGPLKVAWTGSGGMPDAPAGPLCLLDGHIYNLEALANEAGLPSSLGSERVLAKAYARWGEGMLERLRGDFVVLIWDPEQRKGIVARDQLAGRSLYFHSAGDRLMFASEVRYLLRMLPRRPGPDHAALVHWLNPFSGPPSNSTLYEGIRRLPTARYLSMCDGRWEIRRYWEPRYAGTLRGSRSELVEELRSTIDQSVRRRLGNGETMGVLLSGGLDSSSVAAVAKQAAEPGDPPVAAYSATFPNHPSIDEAALIDRLVAKLDLPSVRVVVDRGGSVLGGTLEYLRTWELPPVSPNLFFWQPLLRRAAADGLTGLLDGEGGDELFGLSPYLLSDRLRRGRAISATRLARRFPSGGGGALTWRSTRALLREYGLKGALPYGFHQGRRSKRGPAYYVPPWFTSESARIFFESDDPWFWKRSSGPRWWAYLAGLVTDGRGPALGLDHVRRRAALAGLEARHPLLDVDVIELVLRLPPELAFDPNFTRPLFRESTKGMLPDELRLRPSKSTFDAVFHEALAGSDLPTVRRLLSPEDAEIYEYVHPEQVRSAVLDGPNGHPGGLQIWALHAWRLVTAECWLRSQAEPTFSNDLLATGDLQVQSYALV